MVACEDLRLKLAFARFYNRDAFGISFYKCLLVDNLFAQIPGRP